MGAAELATLDAALRGAALCLLAVLALCCARTYWAIGRSSAWPKLVLALLFSLGAQVLGAWPWLEQNLPCTALAPLIGLSLGNSALFWLVVCALFHDDFSLKPWHLALWAATVALGASLCFAHGLGRNGPWGSGMGLAARLVPVVFSAWALVSAMRYARSDLVEGRRKLRVHVLVLGVLYALCLAAVRLQAGRGQLSPWGGLLDMGLLLVNLAVAAGFLLQLNPAAWLRTQAAPSQAAHLGPLQAAVALGANTAAPGTEVHTPAAGVEAPPAHGASTAQLALVGLLREHMAHVRPYRQEGLSLEQLATSLGVPQYRLRRAIHEGLGYRNFTTFVNDHRLAEVKLALADATQQHLPVLTLALTAGFGSIGPFNRAFKAQMGCTPTEFRAKQLADN